MTSGIRYLSRRDVERLAVSAREIADKLEMLLVAERAGTAWEAPKASIAPGDGRLSLALLSAAREPSLSVLKTVGVSPENAARGLPHIGGVIVVHDGESGMPIAILDAEHITAVRTAAISLVAARRLARVDSRSIGFVGCGVQAASHLDALASELPIERIVAFSRRRESAEALCARAAATGIAGQVAEDAGDALAGVDIVVSSIPDQPGLRPFLDAGRLRPGALAIGVDLGRSWIPETLSAFDSHRGRRPPPPRGQSARHHGAGRGGPPLADRRAPAHRLHRQDRLHVPRRRPRRPRGGVDLSSAGPGARRGGDAGTLGNGRHLALSAAPRVDQASASSIRPLPSTTVSRSRARVRNETRSPSIHMSVRSVSPGYAGAVNRTCMVRMRLPS